MRRSAHRLLSEVFVAAPACQIIDLGDNRFIDILWGTPDQARLTTCFDRIARGICRHHFGENFIGKTKPLLGFVSSKDTSASNFLRFIADKTAMELEGKPKHGANASVFYYQFTDTDSYGLSLLYLVFYGGVKVYVALMPATSNVPTHLGIELMNRGIPTVLTLGDKQYVIDIGSREREMPSGEEGSE